MAAGGVTNGNAQPELFGLGDYFEFVCALARTGAQNRSAICTFWRRKTQRADRRDLTCWGRSHH